jgi:CelD/BcsL family acetyltransferase involved in cellulose biosynthesis
LLVEPLGDLADARADWDRLAERSGNVFATWEWMSTWWELRGEDCELAACTCRRPSGELAAIVPMCVEATGVQRELRFIGHGASDRLGPICDPADRNGVATAMLDWLDRSADRFDIFIGDDTPADEKWGELLNAKTVKRTSSPVLRARGADWDAFLRSRSRNFRDQVRRRDRRLRREHDLRFRLSDGPRLGDDLETLFRLHRERWSERGPTSFGTGDVELHRRFAPRALQRGWLRLWIAELDGRPAAAWYGFRYGGAEWYYQAGRDPRLDALSVGFVLLAHTVREALADGVDEYRLLRGGEPYKARFATDDPGLETIALTVGAR